MLKSGIASIDDTREVQGAPEGWLRRERFEGRRSRQIAKQLGLTQFGVNHVVLEPGAASALRHWHEGEDEFIYVHEGQLTLVDNNGEHILEPVCSAPSQQVSPMHTI